MEWRTGHIFYNRGDNKKYIAVKEEKEDSCQGCAFRISGCMSAPRGCSDGGFIWVLEEPKKEELKQDALTSKRKNFILAVERAIDEFNNDNALEVSGISVNYVQALGAPSKPLVGLDVEFKDKGGF